MPRKLIEFHPEDLRALEALAEDNSSTLRELMDKAVSDFLKKSGRPTSLREALRESAGGNLVNKRGQGKTRR